MITKTDIIHYYDNCHVDYRLLWRLDKSMAMHFGYWDRCTIRLTKALEKQNELLAKHIAVTSTDRVLDAGCGVGGSAIYLAKRVGCHVTGITLSSRQVAQAKQNARKHGVDGLTKFRTMDYLNTAFTDESFDVVWAIESVCHADDKKDFIKEAYRLLTPGGRLVVADGFLKKTHLKPAQQQLMQSWLSGWGVNNLATTDAFGSHLSEVGFQDTQFQDITKRVMPSSRRLFIMSSLAKPSGSIMHWLRLRNQAQTRNMIAAQKQYTALKKDLWHYNIVTAQK